MTSHLHATLERQGTSDVVLVLLHGFPIDSRMWNSMIPLIDDRFTVVTVDQPGLGRSHRTMPVPPTLETTADLVHAHVSEMVSPTSRIVVAGLSMGGYVTAALMYSFHDWLHAVILLDTKTEADSDEQRAKRIDIATIAERDASADIVMGQAKGMLSPHTITNHPELLRNLESLIASQMGLGVAWSQRAMADRPDTTDVVTGSKLPALLIVGDDDSITPVQGMEKLAQNMVNARLTTIEGAGHMAPYEQPQAVAHAINEFLNEVADLPIN